MATDGGGATVTVKRGDLAIIHTVSRVAVNGGESYDSHGYGLHVVTSITRDGAVKALRELTSPDGTPVPVARMGRHDMVTVPATVCDVAALAQHVRTVRASDTGTGYVPAYTSPVEVLRDLAPRVSDPSAIELIRAAAFRAVRESIDFHRARCARCGIYTSGHGTVATDSDGCPMAVCDTCPRGVNFTTDYPAGLEVEVTSGYAQWQTARIDSVIDYVIDGYYGGRSYGVTLAGWGARTLSEGVFKPVHVPADRYAVRRETSQPVEETTAQPETSQPETTADGGASSQPVETTADDSQPVETSHTVPADGGDLAQPETTTAQPETSRETSQPVETSADGGDAALEAAQRSHKLRERARKAVNSRAYTGKPGAMWHLSEVDWPFYNGAYGKAAIYATDNGRAYTVHLFAYHNGDELARVTVKTLDGAFTNGERMADTVPAPAAPAPAPPVEVPADGGEVDMPALTARLARMGFMLAPDGTVTDSGALIEERGGDSRGVLSHADHAQLLTALGDRQGAAMMRAAGALEMPEIDEKTKEPRPRTDSQTAQLRAAIPAGVRGPAIPAIGDGAPAVRGAGTVSDIELAHALADGATVEVDGRRGRVLRSGARVAVKGGAMLAPVAVFFPADGGASLPAPVEAQPAHVSQPVETSQPETSRKVTCPAHGCGRAVRVTVRDTYPLHKRGTWSVDCAMSGHTVEAPAGAAAQPVTSRPVETSREVAQPVAETSAAPADGASSQPVAAETVTCPAPACGRAVRVTRDGCYGSHRSPNLCEMSGKPVGSPAPASRVVFAAQPAAPAAPGASSQPVEVPAVRERDRVRVGFTAGTVVSIDGARALVQLDTGGLPHRVPVADCKPYAPAQPVETIAAPVETSQPVAPVVSLADIAAASGGRVILATVGADGMRPVETSRNVPAQPVSSQPLAPAGAGETSQPETTARAAAPDWLNRATADAPHLYKPDTRRRRDSRGGYRCECGKTRDARRVHLTPRALAEYRAQREQETTAGAPVVAPGVLLLEHTTDGGTVLRGTDKGDGTAAVMGKNGQRWQFSRNIGDAGAWYVPRSRGRVADWEALRKIDRAAVGLAAAGFRVAVVVNGEPREVDGVPAQPVTVETTAQTETTAAPVESQPVAPVEVAAQPAADGGEDDAQPVEAGAAAPVEVAADLAPALAPVVAVPAPAAQPAAAAEWLTPAQTAAMVREALREAFPAVRFSVRCSRGSAVGVHWQDGPTEREVRAVTDAYRGADFDSMQDMTVYRGAVTLPDGRRVKFGARWVTTHRTWTEREEVEAPREVSQPVEVAPAPVVEAQPVEVAPAAQPAPVEAETTAAPGSLEAIDRALRESPELAERARVFAAAVDRTNGELDAAILAHRDNPTAETHARVMAAQRAHNDDFIREETTDYQRRTHAPGWQPAAVETSREVSQPVAPVETSHRCAGGCGEVIGADTARCVDCERLPGWHTGREVATAEAVTRAEVEAHAEAAARELAQSAPAQPVADSRDYPHAAILRELARYILAGRVKVTRRGGAWWYRAPLADGGEVAGGAVWVPGAGAWEVSEVARTAPVPAAPVVSSRELAQPVAPVPAPVVEAPAPRAAAPAPVRPVMPPRVAAALARITAQPVAVAPAPAPRVAQPVAVPAQPVAAPVAPRVAVPAPVAAAPVVAPVAVPAAPAGDRGRYAYAPGTRVRATLREVRRALAAAPALAGMAVTLEADRPTVARPTGYLVVTVEAPAGVDLAAVWAVVDGVAAQHVPAPVLAAV